VGSVTGGCPVNRRLQRAVLDGGFGFYALQVFTTAILILAANTAYQDFPRLSAILARHKLTPHQYLNRGDWLVFSNGIITLAVVAAALLVIFDAEVSRLIQLCVVGVFTAFTLSQAGTVRHWLRTKEPRWQRLVAINSIGAATTGIVLVVIRSRRVPDGTPTNTYAFSTARNSTRTRRSSTDPNGPRGDPVKRPCSRVGFT